MLNTKDIAREKMMEKLADAFFDNLQRDNCEYGAWGVDPKRPFGNSWVEGDIAEIVGIDLSKEDEDNRQEHQDTLDFLNGLYDDLGEYLQWKWAQLKNRK